MTAGSLDVVLAVAGLWPRHHRSHPHRVVPDPPRAFLLFSFCVFLIFFCFLFLILFDHFFRLFTILFPSFIWFFFSPRVCWWGPWWHPSVVEEELATVRAAATIPGPDPCGGQTLLFPYRGGQIKTGIKCVGEKTGQTFRPILIPGFQRLIQFFSTEKRVNKKVPKILGASRPKRICFCSYPAPKIPVFQLLSHSSFFLGVWFVHGFFPQFFTSPFPLKFQNFIYFSRHLVKMKNKYHEVCQIFWLFSPQ